MNIHYKFGNSENQETDLPPVDSRFPGRLNVWFLLVGAIVGAGIIIFLVTQNWWNSDENLKSEMQRLQEWESQVGSALPRTIEALKQEEIEVTKQLTDNFPNHVEPIALLGTVYNNQGKTQEAEKCWQRCLSLDPDYANAYDNMGWIAMRRADYEKAVAMWRKVLQIKPRKPGVYQLIANGLLCLGRSSEAIAALKKEIEINPKLYRSYFFLGQEYSHLKEYEKAKQYYEAAMKIEPRFANTYFGLATVCARLGQKDESRQYREKFKELKAQQYEREKNSSEAFDDMASMSEKVSMTNTEIGRFYLEQGNSLRAEQLWQRAAALDPKNTDCRRGLTALYETANRLGEALEIYEQLRNIEPDNAMNYAFIGALNARLERFDAAEEAMKKAVQLAPHRSEGNSMLAQLYLHRNKNLAEARRLAQTAVKLDPSTWNYLVLSEACDKNGDLAGAVSAMEAVVKKEPYNMEYKMMLRRLQERK
ncbi:MAG: tetratricopeptide repeat protein [Planctomycetes bacterium]|nr:tetratricopeptide repeat protein [Planctomycetota bacterium]